MKFSQFDTMKNSGMQNSDPSAPASTAVTTLLSRWRAGEQAALDALMPLVYEELRAIARRSLRGEPSGRTLRPTVLVNEAYLRMLGASVDWQDRAHFFALAARLMRRILIDHARARSRGKRGGDADFVALSGREASPAEDLLNVLEIDRALEKLRSVDPRKSDVLELHFFGGLGQEEIAVALDISPRTVFQDLKLGKAFLAVELESGASPQ